MFLEKLVDLIATFRDDFRLFVRGRVRYIPVGGMTHSQRYYWTMGKNGDSPIMHIIGRWNVRNATKADTVSVLSASLVPLRLNCVPRSGSINIHNKVGGTFAVGFRPIEPGETTTISADFIVGPPFCKQGKSFTAILVFRDDYGWRGYEITRFHYLG